MSNEIEAKIKVDSLTPIIEKLGELNADRLHLIDQTDTYFTDSDGVLKKKGCGLRIRQQIIDKENSALITFKGARGEGKFKSRPEYETGIDDVETMRKIFESLGFHERLVVKKRRTMWLYGGCEVCLDELETLGSFIEVEGPDEDTISGVLSKLHLENEPHIPDSYATLLSRKQQESQNA